MIAETVKPDGVPWWNEIDPAGAQRYSDFVSNFPGIVSVTKNEVSDSNISKFTFVMLNKAVCDAFIMLSKTNTDWLARKAYNDTNGILSKFAGTGK